MKFIKRSDGIFEIHEPALNIAFVITPHFLQRIVQRNSDKNTQQVKNEITEFVTQIVYKFDKIESNRFLCYIKNDKQIIFRKTYNINRNRNEIEMISYTPNNFVSNNVKVVQL